MVAPEDLVNGITKLLNENAAIELSKIKIDFSEKKKRQPKPIKAEQKEKLLNLSNHLKIQRKYCRQDSSQRCFTLVESTNWS